MSAIDAGRLGERRSGGSIGYGPPIVTGVVKTKKEPIRDPPADPVPENPRLPWLPYARKPAHPPPGLAYAVDAVILSVTLNCVVPVLNVTDALPGLNEYV
jgi:hypothetical protein